MFFLLSDEEVPKEYPKKPCKYVESAQTIHARKKQRKTWRNHVERALLGVTGTSVLDQSILSHISETSESASVHSAAAEEVEEIHETPDV